MTTPKIHSSLVVDSIKAEKIVLGDRLGKPLMTLYRDGRVEFADTLQPSGIATRVLDEIRKLSSGSDAGDSPHPDNNDDKAGQS